MSLALQSLVYLTLIVCGAVAAMPLVVGGPEPVAEEGNDADSIPPETLRVVESPGGRWFLNGEPITRSSLGNLLRQQVPEPRVQYFPSSALAMGQVGRSLIWLRRNGADGAVLAMPPSQP